MEPEETFVHPGACFLDVELVHCALEKSYCNGMDFLSRHQLAFMGSAAEHCLHPHPENLHVGMCSSPRDRFHCTGHASNCGIPAKFVHSIPFCNAQHNHFGERVIPVSVFGKCTSVANPEDSTCVWSSDSCPDTPTTNKFTPASHSTRGHIEDLCTCDKVKVGACVHKTHGYTCAVSPSACDAHSEFRTWQELEAENRQCYLCEKFDKTLAVPIGRQHRPSSTCSSSSGGTDRGAVVGSLVGGLVLGVFIMGMLAYVYRRGCGRSTDIGKRVEVGASAGFNCGQEETNAAADTSSPII